MTAPDFKTRVTEVVSYGVSKGFLLEDITLAYHVDDNPGGWDPDSGSGPNLAPEDILYSMVQITPYKEDPVNIVLEMIDTGDDLYWMNLLTHLSGEGINFTPDMWGETEVKNGYWQIKSYYWAGYYNSAFTYNVETNPGTGFTIGEIVKGETSLATGYIVHEVGTTAKHIAWIQGTFVDGEIVTGQSSSASVIVDTFVLVGELLVDEVYSYTNHQSFLTETRNIVRKLPLDVILPRINEKHVHYVSLCDMFLETLDDAVEVGQIENYITIYDFLEELIERIQTLYCND